MPNAESRASEAEHAGLGDLTPPPVRFDRLALFLDMDGVLAPIAETPDAVRPVARRTALLRRLDALLEGRVAIVSGRTLAEIDRISGAGTLAASGVHGLERRRRDGSVDRATASGGVAVATEAFEVFAREHSGVIVEPKGLSVGLHYRQSPQVEGSVLALAQALAVQTGLAIQPGILVVELKTPGASKGTAIAAFMEEAPFSGATPVMLGDDVTDEDGFRVARSLGGFGVLVGPRRDTAADHRLEDVEAVLDWLESLCDALSHAQTIQEGAA